MFKSIWRYSHLTLAVSSFLILALLSITGVILSFQPIVEKTQIKSSNIDQLYLIDLIPKLKAEYKEVQELELDPYQHLVLSWTDTNGDNQKHIIDATSGKIIASSKHQNEFFEWVNNLHRSLFLKETGRLIVGIASLCLLLIAFSGIGLIIQRQKSITNFFGNLGAYRDTQFYHAFFGRLALVFIVLISFTGAYLTYARFVSKPQKAHVEVSESLLVDKTPIELVNFDIFKKTPISEIVKFQFPFSEFPEDYYILETKEGLYNINQFDGTILSQAAHSKAYQLSQWSLNWHTGRDSILWSIILGISSGYIIYFIISGFIITTRRIRNKRALKNKFTADNADIIILVGSENGSTYKFASQIFTQLLKSKQAVFICSLDAYQHFPKAKHIIVFTATYGSGEPPENATKFFNNFSLVPQNENIKVSVLGFGSRTYPDFCAFAAQVNDCFKEITITDNQLSLETVDDKSPQDFINWLDKWNQFSGFHIKIDINKLVNNNYKKHTFKVVSKTKIDGNNTFIVRLKATNPFVNIQSGDILGIFPANDYRERLYSIGMMHNEIQLCIKLYEGGLGSSYLYDIQLGSRFKAKIINNAHFHLPKRKAVCMISNGTGIAPFLGMIAENKRKNPITLFTGFKTEISLNPYTEFLENALQSGKLKKHHSALSKEDAKNYVYQLVNEQQAFMITHLQGDGVIMICGSLMMQHAVLNALAVICKEIDKDIEHLKQNGKLLLDCY